MAELSKMVETQKTQIDVNKMIEAALVSRMQTAPIAYQMPTAAYQQFPGYQYSTGANVGGYQYSTGANVGGVYQYPSGANAGGGY